MRTSIRIPDELDDFVESQAGRYYASNVSAYLTELVRIDKAATSPQLAPFEDFFDRVLALVRAAKVSVAVAESPLDLLIDDGRVGLILVPTVVKRGRGEHRLIGEMSYAAGAKMAKDIWLVAPKGMPQEDLNRLTAICESFTLAPSRCLTESQLRSALSSKTKEEQPSQK